MPATGRCMCGGVTYAVEGQLRDVTNCHCYRCRRFTGHYLAASAAIEAGAVSIRDQEALLRWYSPVPEVEYGFCGRCGSSLFWRVTARPDRIGFSAGTLDQPTGLHTTEAWWVSEHADYHTPVPGLVEHDRDG